MDARAFLVATVFLAGCGSSSTPGETGLFQPAAAQTQPAASQFAGSWSGDNVSLTLAQNGDRLTGEGIVFENDDPVPVSALGSIKDKSFELELSPESPDASRDYLLQGELNGSGAQCLLGTDGADDERSLNLTRDQASLRLNDDSAVGLPQRLTAHLNTRNGTVVVEITLDDFEAIGSGRTFYGTWRSDNGGQLGPKYYGNDPVTSGYVSGGGIPSNRRFCQFVLYAHPDRPLEDVAKLIFPRPGPNSGEIFKEPLDLSSWCYRPITTKVDGRKTQDRQYIFGHVVP